MLKEVLNNDRSFLNDAVCLVDFNATWCTPCQMLHPILDEISEDMSDKLSFYGIDVDQNGSLAQEFGISSIPCVIIFKNGKEVDRMLGFVPKQNVVDFINKSIN